MATGKYSLRLRIGRRVLALRPGALLITAAVLAGIHLVQLARGKASRVDHRAAEATREIGDIIRANTTKDDCIQVWGWAAWPVYFYADRRACTPIFKVLGQVTHANQNSMVTRSRSADFKPGPLADLLVG